MIYNIGVWRRDHGQWYKIDFASVRIVATTPEVLSQDAAQKHDIVSVTTHVVDDS
jgi:hypothetical protein